jgi:heat-inducible transcriptional repressor
MDMDERKIKILHAIINDYINNGEPIGSRTIAKKYGLGISSATIRNEMADLEEMGYLEHIHTSSGRRPSDKGYRLYVDRLMKVQQITPQEELIIKNQLLNAALYEVEKIIKQATVLLSELTKLTCIVKAPSVKKSTLKAIQLLNIDSNNVLSVIVTDSGIIKNNVIKVSKPVDNDTITKISNLLNARLRALSVEDINLEVINNIKKDLLGYDDIFNAIIPVLYESLNSSETSEVFLEGTTNIFNYPEYNDIAKAREFLSLLSDKTVVNKLLNSSDHMNISIGEENYVPGAKDCSVITTVYSIGDRPIGSIGIIGPTRMHYPKVISILSRVIEELNDNLNHNYDDW